MPCELPTFAIARPCYAVDLTTSTPDQTVTFELRDGGFALSPTSSTSAATLYEGDDSSLVTLNAGTVVEYVTGAAVLEPAAIGVRG